MRRRGVRKLAAAAVLRTAQAYPFPIPGGEPGVWGVHDGDEWFTRHCRKRELEKCKETYERCARDAPAGEGYAAHMCTCADEYYIYGVCAHDGPTPRYVSPVPCSLKKKNGRRAIAKDSIR